MGFSKAIYNFNPWQENPSNLGLGMLAGSVSLCPLHFGQVPILHLDLESLWFAEISVSSIWNNEIVECTMLIFPRFI